MPELGSYSLLLALALSVYALIAGILALARKGPGADLLGETARRAGIAVFVTVLVAAVVLVVAAFQNNFTLAYILHHSNINLPAPYKFAVLWSGQEGSLLFWSMLLATYGLVLRLRNKVDAKLIAFASVIIAAVQVFFLLLNNFAANPFAMVQGTIPPDGNGLNPLLQYPEMVIHPPMLYLGYVGFTVPFAFALGALDHEVSGRKMDTHHAPLDDGDVGVPELRHHSGRALGVLRAGLGRILGMGSGRKCVAAAMANRHGVPAFGDDAGKARHAEDLEHVADLQHFHAGNLRHVPYTQRCGEFGSCIRASRRLEHGS